ncbi:MAG: serine/threonine protein kinase [Candidatus Obscuribacterales bacterium]|nr:serine/threonine protein kinase [Candidatus Obscuribacterales bacterium]
MSDPLYPGLVINERYELLSSLGEGGSGSVFKAKQLDNARLVALKFLHGSQVAQKDSMARFMREGKVLSQFTHKHVPAFYEIGVWNNQIPYIAMEFVDGRSLRTVLDETTRLSWPRCLYIITQICDAMESAHQHGIVHRDLKPNNILLINSPATDFVEIVDFGLAKLSQQNQEKTITETGLLVGSIFYMSPEQCTGKRADNRSDIYSLGCIMYEALSGKLPLEDENPIGMMHKHVHSIPAPVSTLITDRSMPSAVDAILERAMAKQPGQRYQSMKEFADDLRLVSAGEGKVTGAVTLRNLHFKRRRSTGILLAVSALVLGLSSLWFLTDDATCLMLSLRFQGPTRTETLMRQSKDLLSRGRKSAAIKVLELVSQQAERKIDRAAALLKLSELYYNDQKKEQSKLFAERALTAIAKSMKKGNRNDARTNSNLALLLTKTLQLLSSAGESVIFDYSLPNRKQAEVNAALIAVESYFRSVSGYPETLWSIKTFEKKAIDEVAKQRTSMAQEYYSEYALLCFQCGKTNEGFQAVDTLLSGTPRGLHPTLRATRSNLTLAEFLLSDSTVFNDKVESPERVRNAASKLIGLIMPVFASQEWRLLQQVEPATVLDGHQRMARLNLKLQRINEAREQLDAAVKIAQYMSLSPDSILAVCKVYGDLAEIDTDSGNYAAAEDSLNKGRAFLSSTFTQASAHGQPERAATAELCKGQLTVWSGDLSLARKNFARAEAEYRDGFTTMINMASTISEWLGNSKLPPSLRSALEQARDTADRFALETSARIHKTLLAQRRPSDAITFHRLSIAGLREISRSSVSGALYGLLAEAMVVDGRYDSLDKLLEECRNGSAAGPGMYEQNVRLNIVLDAARAYAAIGEYSRAARVLPEKSSDPDKLILIELTNGDIQRHLGHAQEAGAHLLRAETLADASHSLYRRRIKFALARLALVQGEKLNAERKLAIMLTLPALADEDTAAEAAYAFAASNNRYSQALAVLNQTAPNDYLKRIERCSLICELALALNHQSDNIVYSKKRSDVLKEYLGNKHPAVANRLFPETPTSSRSR